MNFLRMIWEMFVSAQPAHPGQIQYKVLLGFLFVLTAGFIGVGCYGLAAISFAFDAIITLTARQYFKRWEQEQTESKE